MGDRTRKDALFAEFAAVGKVLGNPGRLELLDLLSQGPRSVESLAEAAGLGMSTCSAHLQTLREAGLVESRRDGKRVYYSLAGNDVAGLWDHLRRVAQSHRPHTELARRAYLGPEDTAAVDTDELLRRLVSGDVVILDVRPGTEFAAGHLPGAINVPLEELAGRIGELPRDHEIVAYCRGRYCVLAHDAVRLLTAEGLDASRAADGVLEWRIAGVRIETGAA
ncbi:ArsR/SmtB family transcription factor [Nocardioides ganghwensis]|uniref:Metalloregulator ArsR/SmtB family transcription factor n=1 Tax=Nocardioides ganghwensis TaxID=252230 RepID=A0A4Q2S708_9ACTN|nr:metalloregulator ArsR/SmtB family transcription factor [Nocardioides ganghwensis]MBD3947796.1 metalloregulator ArsR/SmtB family transcription factor [Nocardioides ganghwensis]RYB98121.1 metalloregulator ArsR/SmtB family transcription factor [Nocardioides ganghwensis]